MLGYVGTYGRTRITWLYTRRIDRIYTQEQWWVCILPSHCHNIYFYIWIASVHPRSSEPARAVPGRDPTL